MLLLSSDLIADKTSPNEQNNIYTARHTARISTADTLSYFGHILVIRTPIWVNQSLLERGQQDLQL